MTAHDSVLAVDDVIVTRDGRRILHGLSMEIHSESQVLIRGESGAGKTTLFQLLGLLATPDSGQVVVNGVTASGLSETERARIRRTEIGLVFQNFQLIPDLTAWENALVPQEHMGGQVDEEWIFSLFDSLEITNKKEQYPATLSGGEMQRVAIARSLANRPAVVIADEPTGQLDTETSQRVLNLLHGLHNETGTSLVVISHDTAIGERFQEVKTLKNGRFDEGSNI